MLSILFAFCSESVFCVCPRCGQLVTRGTCSVLLCAVPIPTPSPVCVSVPGVRRTPQQRAYYCKAVASLGGEEEEGARQSVEVCPGRPPVSARGSYTHIELVCPRGARVSAWGSYIHMDLMCLHGAHVSMQSLCPRGARVSTQSSSPADAPALGAWKQVWIPAAATRKCQMKPE